MTFKTTSPRNAAMNLLARREHSQTELRRKLRTRFEPEALDEALERLLEEGLLSDERFAMSFTRERLLRGHGPMRIQSELRQRGVSERLAEKAIANIPLEESITWEQVARSACEKKYGDATPVDIPEKVKRSRFLSYRGFSSDQIQQALGWRD